MDVEEEGEEEEKKQKNKNKGHRRRGIERERERRRRRKGWRDCTAHEGVREREGGGIFPRVALCCGDDSSQLTPAWRRYRMWVLPASAQPARYPLPPSPPRLQVHPSASPTLPGSSSNESSISVIYYKTILARERKKQQQTFIKSRFDIL